MQASAISQRYKLLQSFAADTNYPSLLRKSAATKSKAMPLVEILDVAAVSWSQLGFCEWRHSICDPTESLRKSIALVAHAAIVLQPFLASTNGRQVFWYPPCIYTSLLLDNKTPEQVVAALPDFSSWSDVGQPSVHYFDVAHFHALIRGAYPQSWGDFIIAMEAFPESTLLANTHKTYHSLITSSLRGRIADVEAACLSLCDMYQRRSADSLFSTSYPTEGPDVDNEFCVDYRLVSILHYLREIPGLSDVSSRIGFHRWQW